METLNEESKDSQIEYGDSCGFFLLGLSDFLKIYFVCIFVYKHAVVCDVGGCDCLGVRVEVRH